MRSSTRVAAAVALGAASAQAVSFADMCTASYLTDNFPAVDFFQGITLSPSSLTANPVYNHTVTDEYFYPDATFDFCNVTFTYSHDGRDDDVLVTYWMPTPDNFQNRFLATGGGGYAINSETGSLPGGVEYGAVAGQTDAGFGIYQTDALEVFLLANGTLDYESIYMFGYNAIHEMTVIGKEFTSTAFGLASTNATLYAYYQGCSEGGREGWSQVQRFAEQFDGAAIGAPAFRFAFQQVQHLAANVAEIEADYFPPPCELEKIMNETISACDAFDGRVDGVVARTDLCILNYNISGLVGTPYYCAASAASMYSGATPAQNGTITQEAVELAQKILDGPHTSDGKRIYFSYQPTSTWDDADTTYNETSGEWELAITSLGGSFVEELLFEIEGDNLQTLDGVTFDTIREWIELGWNKYNDVLMTNWPDIAPFRNAGGKVIHFHGESDYSIPTASSVRYWESVRSILYPNLDYNSSVEAMNEFYRLFLVPGGSHCAPNSYEPNGPWPQTSLPQLIDWVENGNAPVTLNGTVLQGDNKGDNQQICGWPLRPLWTDNGTSLECVYDQASHDTWIYDLDAFLMPVY